MAAILEFWKLNLKKSLCGKANILSLNSLHYSASITTLSATMWYLGVHRLQHMDMVPYKFHIPDHEEQLKSISKSKLGNKIADYPKKIWDGRGDVS